MDPFFHTGLSISDSLKTVRKSVLIYETIIHLTYILHVKISMAITFTLRLSTFLYMCESVIIHRGGGGILQF